MKTFLLKVVSFFFILIGLFLLMLPIDRVRQMPHLIGDIIPEWGRYGDLYSLTDLPQFREKAYYQNKTLPLPTKPLPKNDNVDLYLMGDSFTNPIDLQHFQAHKAKFIRIGVGAEEVILDSTRKSILVIQNVERGIADRFTDQETQKLFLGLMGFYTKTFKAQYKAPMLDKPAVLRDFGGDNTEDLFRNLLFNHRVFGKIKELKAQINWKVFGRINGDHVVSKDGKYLCYRNEATIQPNQYTSSYCALDSARINLYINNLTRIRKHYLDMGFDKVVFVFVPNKASICAPDDYLYNHQIEQLQASATEHFEYIDLYNLMLKKPELYHIGDGHWNNKGEDLFVSQINKLLLEN